MRPMRNMRYECGGIQEVSMILLRDDSVCLVRRANTGYMDGMYCFPAGHKEPGEAPLSGAIREAFEETGVRIDPADVRHVHTMHRMCHGRIEDPDHERVAYFFVAEAWDGEPANVEPEKSDHVGWFSFDALPDVIPYMRDALGYMWEGKAYSESLH